MKILAGLLYMALGVWCVVDNRRLAGLRADRRPWKLLRRGASVKVHRVIAEIVGLGLIVGGAGLLTYGWGEFK